MTNQDKSKQHAPAGNQSGGRMDDNAKDSPQGKPDKTAAAPAKGDSSTENRPPRDEQAPSKGAGSRGQAAK